MNQAAGLPDWLRELTYQAHAELEATPLMRRLAAGSLAAEAYHQLLCGFAAFHKTFEPRLSAALPDAFREHLQGFHRGGALAADLAHWRQAGRPTRAVTIPPCMLSFDDEATAVGAFYVIEGATLGARTIHERLRTALDGQLRGCDTYFSARGERTEPDWQKARGLIEDYGRRHPRQWQTVGAGALAVFAEVHRVLTGADTSGKHQLFGDRQD